MLKKIIIKTLVVIFLFVPILLQAEHNISQRLSGYILLQVEDKGKAWYVNPDNKKRYFLGRPDDAFSIMRNLSLGVSESDFNNFQNNTIPEELAGKILLRVESHGKAYYVNPDNLKLHYLARPQDAFLIMRELSLGISNYDLKKIKIAKEEEIEEKNNKENEVEEMEEIKEPKEPREVRELDISYSEFMKESKSPEELVIFLNQYFLVNNEKALKAKNIKEIWENQEGSQVDLAYLISQIIKDDISISGIIRYDYKDENGEKLSNVVNIFRNQADPAIIVSEKYQGFNLFKYGSSFIDLMKFEEERLNIDIYRYGYFSSIHDDFSEIQAPFTWQKY